MKSDEKKCPRCAEIVKAEAKVCKHCGYEFSAADLAEQKSKQSADKNLGSIGCVVLVIALLFGVSMCSSKSEQDTAKEDAKAAQEAAETHRKGFHCLSGWDGSNRSLVQQVKDRLREPSSFEHVETRITPVDDKGQHGIVMEYRARNGFGGMNVSVAMGTVDTATCTATLTTSSVGGN